MAQSLYADNATGFGVEPLFAIHRPRDRAGCVLITGEIAVRKPWFTSYDSFTLVGSLCAAVGYEHNLLKES